MGTEKELTLNLISFAVVIISLGLIYLGRWVRPEKMLLAFLAQGAALTLLVIAGFTLKL